MYKLFKANETAAPVLSQLWIDTFAGAYAGVHSTENILAYCAKNFSVDQADLQLKDSTVLCKIAEWENFAVGFYLLKKHDCPVLLEGRSTELKQIYILSDHFGKGLGKLLYDDALIEARNDGRDYIWLNVSDINYRALAFYKNLEFEAVGKGPVFHVGVDRLTSTVMVKQI